MIYTPICGYIRYDDKRITRIELAPDGTIHEELSLGNEWKVNPQAVNNALGRDRFTILAELGLAVLTGYAITSERMTPQDAAIAMDGIGIFDAQAVMPLPGGIN